MMIVLVLLCVNAAWSLPTNLRDCDYCHRNAARCNVGHVVENACVRCECSAERQYQCQAVSPACTDDQDNVIQGKPNEARCDPHNMYVLGSVTCMCSKSGFWPHDKCAAMFKSLPNPEHSNKLKATKADLQGEVKKTVATNDKIADFKKILTANKDLEILENGSNAGATNGVGATITAERETCEPNTYVVKDCNVCKCNAQGMMERCTQNHCSAQAQLERSIVRRTYSNLPAAGSCVPNNWYALGPCQFCYCQQANKLVCSTRAQEHKLVSLGAYRLNDCGQGLVKELYDLGPTQVSRENNEVKNTAQAAPHGYAVDVPPSHAARLPPTQAIPLPPAPVASLPAAYASPLSNAHVKPLSSAHLDAAPAGEAAPVSGAQSDTVQVAQSVDVPSAKTQKPPTHRNPMLLKSGGNMSKTPVQTSLRVQIHNDPLKVEYETEYEDDPAAQGLREREPTLSPFENDEESVEAEEEANVPSSYVRQPDGSYKPVFDKQESLRIPSEQQPSMINAMMTAQGMPKEMVQILSSMPEVSQMQSPLFGQEAREVGQEVEVETESENTRVHKYDVVVKPAKQEVMPGQSVLRINLPTVLERIIQLALRKSMVKIDASQSCMPGTTSQDGCNFCYCLNNGKLLCTDKKTC